MKQLLLKHKQILFFILAGATSAVVEIIMMKCFSYFIPQIFPQETNLYGIKYPFSNICSTACAILVNYWLSINFVFQTGKHSRKKEFTYFMLISGTTTLLSLSIFQVFINFVFLNPVDFKIYAFSPIILSKIMAIGIVSIINYMVKKRIVFNG